MVGDAGRKARRLPRTYLELLILDLGYPATGDDVDPLFFPFLRVVDDPAAFYLQTLEKAEREGFEPSRRLNTAYAISNPKRGR
jgi:hypothetical protein